LTEANVHKTMSIFPKACIWLFSFWTLLMFSYFAFPKNTIGTNDTEVTIKVDDLKKYDHDIQTKEWWFLDIWNEVRDLNAKAQRQRELHNSLESRVYELEKKQGNANKPQSSVQKEVVAMISNEWWQGYSFNDENLQEKKWDIPTSQIPWFQYNVWGDVVYEWWNGNIEVKKSDWCRVMHKVRPDRENTQAYKYANYSYVLWWWDMVLLWNAENGWWVRWLQSWVPTAWWKEESYWFCQLLRQNWYNKIVLNTERFWKDSYRQLDRCYEKYATATDIPWQRKARDNRHKRWANLYLECE